MIAVSQSVGNVTTIDFRQFGRSLAQRLETMCEGIVSLESESDQYITVAYSVSADASVALADTVLRVAREFVSNAVTHGMHMRLLGRIDVSVATVEAGLVLSVIDDGWGCGAMPTIGEGLSTANRLAGALGGTVSLKRVGDRTIAEMSFARVTHA